MTAYLIGLLVGTVAEDHTAVMKLWSRRYHDLGGLRTQLVCRLHAVLCELVPGGFARRISATQAIQVLDQVTAHGPVPAAKLELAREFVEDLQRIDEQRRSRAALLVSTTCVSWCHSCCLGLLTCRPPSRSERVS
jgi:hypothetical protein